MLNLNSMPDFVVLADTCAQYTLENFEDLDAVVLNPGNFSCSKTFSIIYPHKGNVEESSLRQEAE